MSQKDAYVEKMEAQLKQFGARFDHLKAKAEEKVADGKIKMNDAKESSKAEYEKLVAKFDEIKAAGDDKWEALKATFEQGWSDLTKSQKKPPKITA